MPSTKSTLTLYFCGTGNNMTVEKQYHTVPKLISMAMERHMGFDGPGGNPGNKPVYKKKENGDFAKGYDKKKIYVAEKGKSLTGAGQLRGKGANANVLAAADWIDLMIEQTENGHHAPITTINLCGFSRGAVTATIVAWIIEKVYAKRVKNLRCNMFLIDPVAGGLNEFQKSYKIDGEDVAVYMDKVPNVVQNFTGLLAGQMLGMMGQKEDGFASTMPKQGAKTENYKVYVTPGGHGAATAHDTSNSNGSLMGKIGLHMAQAFLKKHGSAFSGSVMRSDKDLIELYAAVRHPDYGRGLNPKEAGHKFFDENNKAVQTTKRAALAKKFSKTFGRHPYYVNDHHYDLVQGTLPDVATDMKQSRLVTEQTLTKLKNQGYKVTADFLETLDMVD